MRLTVAAFAVLVSLPLAAAPLPAAPQHAQYLPPDDQSLRQGEPEQQQLLQVTEYSIVAGNERLSNQQPIPVTAPLFLRLKGKSLNPSLSPSPNSSPKPSSKPPSSKSPTRSPNKSPDKNAALSQVLITFDGESKSLKKPVFDEASNTLTLNYPLSMYRSLVDMLRNETVYVQFLTYANGHIWADLHTTGGPRAR